MRFELLHQYNNIVLYIWVDDILVWYCHLYPDGTVLMDTKGSFYSEGWLEL